MAAISAPPLVVIVDDEPEVRKLICETLEHDGYRTQALESGEALLDPALTNLEARMLALSGDSLDWALRHIRTFGDTDVFPVPFEFTAIAHCWPLWLRDEMRGQDVEEWSPRPYRRCLSPKHRYSFRVSTQLDPLDSIVFAALVFEIGDEVERARVPTREGAVFSFRFLPRADGQMYDPSFNYGSFQTRSRELLDGGGYDFVVVTDIADFYPRLYLHPLENALAAASKHAKHIRALKSLLKSWNFSVSYGIPVGPAPSRLLAELAIDDIDRTLLSDHVPYCRYLDDFRLFSHDERRAHEHLALLANALFENHGLTLQPQKTAIVDADTFRRRYLREEEEHERESLSERFQAILQELGIDNFYEDIEYDELDSDTQAKIDGLNLAGILEEQISGDGEMDLSLTRFVLRRLRQLDDSECVDLVMRSMPRLYPVFTDAIGYLRAMRSLDAASRKEIGDRLIRMLRDTILGHLEYHRCWVFDIFTKDREWDNEGVFADLHGSYPDEFSRRKLTLALGRTWQSHWFKTRKRSVYHLSPWERRAFLAAASCLPGDEAGHWYRSIVRQADLLEKAVIHWARDCPFRG